MLFFVELWLSLHYKVYDHWVYIRNKISFLSKIQSHLDLFLLSQGENKRKFFSVISIF